MLCALGPTTQLPSPGTTTFSCNPMAAAASARAPRMFLSGSITGETTFRSGANLSRPRSPADNASVRVRLSSTLATLPLPARPSNTTTGLKRASCTQPSQERPTSAGARPAVEVVSPHYPRPPSAPFCELAQSHCIMVGAARRCCYCCSCDRLVWVWAVTSLALCRAARSSTFLAPKQRVK